MKTTKFDFYLKNRYIINLVLLTCLFFIHCFWGNMMYVAFPILLLMVMFDNLTNGLSYIIYSIPYCMLNLYVSAIIFFVSIVTYVIKFYVILTFKEKQKPNYWTLAFIFVFFVYCVLPIGDYNINMLIKICILLSLFIVLCMVSKKPDVIRLPYNFRLLALSLIISCAMSVTWFVSPYLQEYLSFRWTSDGVLRFAGLLSHTNVLAMICEILVSVFAYFVISKRFSWKDIVLFIVLAMLGFTTFSKTYIIILFVVLFCLFIWALKNNFAKTMIVSCILASVVLVACIFNMDIVMVFVNRFIGSFSYCHNFNDFMNMITTYRYNLWGQYAQFLITNPLNMVFGRGLGAPVLSTLSAHNAYLSMVYQLGLVGSLLFITCLILIIRQFIKNSNSKPTKAIIVPLIVIALIFCVEDVLFYIFL